MDENKSYAAISFLFIILLSLGGALIIKETGFPSGSDIGLHLRLANGWMKGDIPVFNESYFNNNYPYPPAFHITLALLSKLLLTEPITIVSLLQVILYPLTYLSTFYLVYRKTDGFTSAMTVILLGTSPAFWDRSSQVIPQAVDLAIFPLAAYLYLTKRDRLFTAASVYLFYSHSMYAALPLLSLFLYSFIYERERLAVFLKILLISIPLIFVIGANLEGLLSESRSINEEQEDAVLREPLFAIKYLGYPLFFLLISSLIHLRFKKPQNFEKLILLWIIALVPMTIFFPDRFIQYLSQPLSILAAITIADVVNNKRIRLFIYLGLIIFALLLQRNLFTTLVQNGEVLMPLDTLSPFVK